MATRNAVAAISQFSIRLLTMRPFGSTGLSVPILGLGAGHIGDPSMPEADVARLLEGAVDAGVTLIDTAPSYGMSEERIGRHLRHRRNEVILSTKLGYGVPGAADWTAACIAGGIDLALGRLRADVIDIAHLHSCPRGTLEHGEVIDALERAVEAGKVRVAAYSGDNEPLEWAVMSGRFNSIQASLSFCDQFAVDRAAAAARSRGVGVIAKRPVANAPWRDARPSNDDAAAAYWDRFRALRLDSHGLSWQELALRFAVFHTGADCSIIGTRSLDHLRANVAIVEKGPLAGEIAGEVRAAFRQEWRGMV